MRISIIDEGVRAAKAESGVFPFKLVVYLYNVDGVMIDAGSANILRKTISFMEHEKISCAAITHVHEDHTGAAAWIKENLHVPVYLHKKSIEEAAVKSHIPLYRRLVWGNREGFDADNMPEFIETGKYRLDVINAPGHHPNHVVFHEKNMGWLFTGDLYVSRRQTVAFKDENLSDAIDTITRILDLDFDTILCGHSGIHKNGKEKFREKLDFFLGVKEQVGSLRAEGLTDTEIDRVLFPGRKMWTVISGGEWSSLNMIRTV